MRQDHQDAIDKLTSERQASEQAYLQELNSKTAQLNNNNVKYRSDLEALQVKYRSDLEALQVKHRSDIDIIQAKHRDEL